MANNHSKSSLLNFYTDVFNIHRSKIAIIDLKNPITYAELKKYIEFSTRHLENYNISSNEPIGCLVSNQGWDVVNYFAIWSTNGVVVPIHEKASSRTIEDIINRTGLRLIIKDPRSSEWPELLVNNNYTISENICYLNKPPHVSRSSLVGAAFIIFTSGSTGLPKGVILSHEAFSGKLEAINKVLKFGNKNKILLVLQLTFSFGIWVSFLTLRQGGTLCMDKKFEPLKFINLIINNEINTVAVVPTMLRSLISLVNSTNCNDLINSLSASKLPNLLITGGEVLPFSLGKEIKNMFPHTSIADVYGLTETCTSDFILAPEEYDLYEGTIGKPTPGVQYRITDDKGIKMPVNTVGELEILTPFIMSGYLDQDDLTFSSFHDNYIRTGDLARERESGAVEIVGRKKELIYKGGNKISPLEIENIFQEHPEISHCLAVSVPDKIMGEKIFLFVVTTEESTINANHLKLWAVQKLDKYKVPDIFHFCKSLPVGSTGKISRSAAKDLIFNEKLVA